MRLARRRPVVHAGVGLSLAVLLTTAPLLDLTTAPRLAAAAERSRADELKRVIDRNTGFAHMTRGVNMYTVIALRSCVTERDVPVLAQLLSDRDYVTQLASASVMADLGEDGKRALQQALAAARDVRTRDVIQDALREAESPTRRPILDYPLSSQERQRIRGCGPFAGRG